MEDSVCTVVLTVIANVSGTAAALCPVKNNSLQLNGHPQNVPWFSPAHRQQSQQPGR